MENQDSAPCSSNLHGSITSSNPVGAPEPPIHLKANTNSVLVSPKQRSNPLLKFITNVPWEYDDRVIADYVMGQTTCALFLSIRYHNLNPDYIQERLTTLGKNFRLRVLLILVDVKDPDHAIKGLTRISILTNMTLMLCRSFEEAGKIIERYKIYQFKPADLIMEKKDGNSHARVMSALTSVRSVNKTDALILLSNFETLAKICQASEADLAVCPGLGAQKAARLYKVLHEPFLKESATAKKRKINE